MKMSPVTNAQGKGDVLFIERSVYPPAFQDNVILTLACQP